MNQVKIGPIEDSGPRHPWKWHKSKEGFMVSLPSKLQLRPSKYSPGVGRGKTYRNQPYCYKVGPKHGGCTGCLWRFNC